MSTHVLARKYRPQTFAEVIGQDHVIRAIRHGVAQGKLHHAYLLTGTRGVGKTTLARILAKAVNCLNLQAGDEPCGQCDHCRAIEKGAFPDLVEIDAASNTGVDAMRGLLDTVAYPPYLGRRKVYVIDEVHMLSNAAFNSMLKTLEEPPAYLTFVLATTDPQKVPITILSRCMQFNLKALPESLLIAHFQSILERESIDYDREALPMVARSADGSVRDGLSLLDQLLAQGGGAIKIDKVQSILGIVEREAVAEILRAVIVKDLEELMARVEALSQQSIDFEEVLGDLARLLLSLQILQLGGSSAFESDRALYDRLQHLKGQCADEVLQMMYQILINGRRDLPYAPDGKSGFLMTLLRMMAFMPAPSAAPPTNAAPPTLKTAALAASPPLKGEAASPAKNLSLINANASATKLSKPNKPDGALKTSSLDFLAECDWVDFVRSMALPAPLRRIAAFSAPDSLEAIPTEHSKEYVLTMAVAHSEKHLIELSVAPQYLKTLQKALEERYHQTFIVQYRLLGADEGEEGMPQKSLAYSERARHRALAASADQAIANDPIWLSVTQNYSAKIVHREINLNGS